MPSKSAAYPSGHTTNQWLIERGQPEGEQNAVWLEHTGVHPATEGRWTSNAWDAAMFPDKAAAEAYIAERGLEARAVEHGFMFPRSGRDTSAADVDGIESPAGPHGHHESVGERQGRQPAPSTSSAATKLDVQVVVDLPGPKFLCIRQNGVTYARLSDVLAYLEETATTFDKAHANADIGKSFRACRQSIEDATIEEAG